MAKQANLSHSEDKPRTEESKDSALGFVSFIISLVCGFLEFPSLLYFFVGKGDSLFMIAVNVLILGGLLACLVGAFLGLIVFFQANRNKKLAGLGLILNLCIFFGMLGVLWLGIISHPPPRE